MIFQISSNSKQWIYRVIELVIVFNQVSELVIVLTPNE